MEQTSHKKQKSNLGLKNHQKHLIIGSVVVFIGILVAVASVLIYQSGPTDERPTDEIILNSGEPIPASECSTDTQCVLVHGTNSYCVSGNCFKYVTQNTLPETTSPSSGRSYRSSGGSDNTETNEAPTSILGFFERFFTGNAVSAEAGEVIYYNDGYIGIGTDSPESRLEVGGKITSTELKVKGFPAQLFLRDTFSDSEWSISNLGDTLFLGNEGGTKLIVASDGNIGIGTTEPTAKLAVAGDIHPTLDNAMVIGTSGKVYNKLRLGKNYGGIDWYDSSSSLAGTIYMPNSNNLVFSNFENVGIGTVAPRATLDVKGPIRTQPQTAPTCDSSTLGTIFYSSLSNHFFGCKYYGGTIYNWVQLDN